MGRTDTRPRRWPHRVLAVALVLAGGVVTAWPIGETLVNNTDGARETAAYVQAVQQADPAPLAEQLVRARAYNAALPATALFDPWGDEDPARSPAHDAYLKELAEFDAMGRVRIPQIQVDLPIFHDATKVPLARGAGHMYGTSLPVGGAGTHAVLAGHTGMKSRTMFDRLPEVQVGQTFFIDVAGTTLTYRVDRTDVVEPTELSAVERVPGADLVTLVTCYTPPGEHKQRLLVRGVRVPDAAASVSQVGVAASTPVATDTSVQEWMVPRLAVAGGAVGAVLLMMAAWTVDDRRDRLAAASGPRRAVERTPSNVGGPR